MQKENISLSQFMTLIINFLLGSAIVVGVGSDAKNDAWIAIFISSLIGLLIVFFFYKLSSRLPEKSLFEIFAFCLGRKVSVFLSFLYVVYFLYAASRVVRDFGELIAAAIMPNTPIEVISVTFSLLMSYIVYLGLEVLGRTSEIFTPYVFLFYFLLTVFLVFSGNVDFKHILPVLGDGAGPVAETIFPVMLTFPFGEFVAFMVVLPYVTNKKYQLRVLLIGTGISSILLTISSWLMICTLGVDTMQRSNFPLLNVARNVSIGNFIERVDALVVFIMLLTIFVKGCIYYFGALKGLEHIFHLPFRYFSVPMALLISLFSVLIAIDFADHIEEGLGMAPYILHVPFQFIIPSVIFAIVLWKQRKKKQVNEAG